MNITVVMQQLVGGMGASLLIFVLTLLFSMLDFLGIERDRTRVEWVSAAEGNKFAAVMNDFVETITKLGENKRLEDLRCKK